MAERRMFAKTIVDSDAFLDMPSSAQALYFHLGMRADDDGFVNSPRKIQRIVNSSDDDLKILLAKRFLIPFESGIVVIKHWRMHNYIQSDRYHPTVHHEEKARLQVKDNGAYTESIQDVSRMEAQVRLGKDRIDKDREDTMSGSEDATPTPHVKKDESCEEGHKILDYLNSESGKHFRYTDANMRPIKARLKEGFTFDDFRLVIDYKANTWGGDPKMSEYVRPLTLFGTKFESYREEVR